MHTPADAGQADSHEPRIVATCKTCRAQEYYLNVLAAPPKPEASKLAAMLDSYGAARALKHLVRRHWSHHLSA